MNTNRSTTIAEALRLTRIGRQAEASALLQRGLSGASIAGPAVSPVAELLGGLGPPPSPLPNDGHDGYPEAPGAHPAPACWSVAQNQFQ